MQLTAQLDRKATTKKTWNGVERRRVEKVVETLATLGSRGENLSEVAHDARNMVAALGLYCDLLEEPGVLATPFAHYAHELRLVAAASRRLVEKLVVLDTNAAPSAVAQMLLQVKTDAALVLAGTAVEGAQRFPGMNVTAGNVAAFAGSRLGKTGDARALQNRNSSCDLLPDMPVSNLAAELMANRNLLAALAGPSVALTLEVAAGAQAVRLTSEDLTRLLVNLVKNAAEAMAPAPARTAIAGRRIAIGLREAESAGGTLPLLLLTIDDNGPGIPEETLETIFTSGYTSRGKEATTDGWPQNHRGLGLAIVRSIVEGAGGRITASNRAQGGARFTLELPVRKTGNRE